MNLIDRVKKMVTTPKTEWEVVAVEAPDASKVIMGYVVPLCGVAAVAAFLGIGFLTDFVSIRWCFMAAIMLFLLLVLIVLLTAFVSDLVAPSLGAEKNLGRSVQLLGYGCTPLYLSAILSIFPSVADIFLILGGLYSAYLIFLGVMPIKKITQDKQAGYAIVTIGIAIGVFFLLRLILKRIFFSMVFDGYGPYNINF
ncbi:MAG TPA: Yip1 family protein [Chitinophagaceae bacterium]|nr:Yip1 family protein [Chitinophagaceae bacterium]